jgi:hypothetical protein
MPNPLISAEDAARLLAIPLVGIGKVIESGRLRFYKAGAFLRSDVQRLRDDVVAETFLATLRPPARLPSPRHEPPAPRRDPLESMDEIATPTGGLWDIPTADQQ